MPQLHREVKPVKVRQFLGIYEDTVYSFIPDGFGTYIVLMHNAHGDVMIMQSHVKITDIEKLYNIKL